MIVHIKARVSQLPVLATMLPNTLVKLVIELDDNERPSWLRNFIDPTYFGYKGQSERFENCQTTNDIRSI